MFRKVKFLAQDHRACESQGHKPRSNPAFSFDSHKEEWKDKDRDF